VRQIFGGDAAARVGDSDHRVVFFGLQTQGDPPARFGVFERIVEQVEQ
jgi:hypothetical protein